MLERLQQLDGFDHQAVGKAMSCTENAQFLCWEKHRGVLKRFPQHATAAGASAFTGGLALDLRSAEIENAL